MEVKKEKRISYSIKLSGFGHVRRSHLCAQQFIAINTYSGKVYMYKNFQTDQEERHL